MLSAPVLVFVAGLLFSRHVIRHWQSPNPSGRRSGLGIVAVLLPLVASGYLIQTVTDERLLDWLVTVHLVTWDPPRRVRPLPQRTPGPMGAADRPGGAAGRAPRLERRRRNGVT